ncbi:MAG: hypothetical protein ABSG84_18260 [Acidobacteriaceae bacterium]
MLLAAPAQTPANRAPAAEQAPPPDLMSVSGRLSIETPGSAFHLGEENALTISLKGPPPAHVITTQREASADGMSPWIQGGDGEVSVLHRVDGSAYVNVVPQRLGKIEFQLMVVFADGGWEQESVTVPVIAVGPPKKLQLGWGSMFHSAITMDLSQKSREEGIVITADYPGLKQPLEIPFKDARLNVRMAKGEPPIRFDPATGKIDALRLGEALVEATYRGSTAEICIVVSEDSEWGAYRSNCDAVKQGNKTRDEIVEAMLAENHSELPYGPQDGRKGRFLAEDRVEMVAPAHPLNVAEDNAMVMKVHGSTVARVECDSGNTGCTRREGYTKPPLPFTFQQQADGNVLVQIFPGQPGAAEFNFTILFTDGGVAHKTLAANVGFGTKLPRGINMPCGNDSYANPNLPQHMVAENPGWQGSTTTDLWINACYDGIAGFVVLPPKELTYRVLSEGDKPAIRVDSATGQVTALTPGQALLEREFHGLKSETCFVVAASGPPDAGDLSNCRDLRAKFGAPLPEPPPPPKLPQVVGQNAAGVIKEMQGRQAIQTALLSPQVKDRFNADARVEIPVDGVSLPLGEPAKLSVRLTGPEVLRTVVVQELTEYNGKEKPLTVEDVESFDDLKIGTIERAADGSAFVRVVARRADTAEFRFSLLFADGGVASRTIEVPVTLPDGSQVRLTNAAGGDLMDADMSVSIMHLLMTAPDNVRWLYPFVLTQQSNWPIALGPGDVKMSVQQASDPVVRLDTATGAVAALRLGHALVRMEFAGAESETCVVVMANATEGDPSNCDELRGKR